MKLKNLFPMRTNVFLAMLVAGGLVWPGVAADFEKAVSDLIPRMADDNVPARYDAWMELQELAADAGKPGNEAARAALVKVLTARVTDTTVPQPATVWIIRQLENIGRADAVEALTVVLNGDNAELRECARRALEKNPAPAASQSLYNALVKAAADSSAQAVTWKTGLINSLGERRDAAAVVVIAPRLREPGTAIPAALALGKIGNTAAVDALWSVCPGNPAAADALLNAANYSITRGARPDAAAICRKLYDQASTPTLRAAALAGLARADAAAAQPLVQALLAGSDVRLQKAAVDAAPQAFGGEFSKVLADKLPSLPPTAKVFVLRVLEPSAEQAALAAVNDAEAEVRVAALEALGRIGGADSVPAMLQAAAGDSGPEHSTALAALAVMNGEGAGAAIEKTAAEGEARQRAVAIAALADRNATSTLPTLVKYAAESDPVVSKAACAALAKIGTDAELPPLVELVLAGKTAGADDALQSIAARTDDRSGAARLLVAKAGSATGPQLASILDVLSLLGGEEALKAVTLFTGSNDAGMRDAAIRALANWPEFAGAKPLLDIAANPQTAEVHHVLALQGVNRLVKTSETEPAAARVDAALAALKAARRDQEKKLALSSLGAIPDRRAGEALLPMLKDSQWGKDAGTAALNVADALRRRDRNTARTLAEAVKAANLSEDLNQRADSLLRR
jgi:HEAT repeat protein